uniref:Uncharacterized protein n=1 Tax=Oryza punctata TaxID=4537 RepID=A0A0E0JTX9_ORYPU
MPENRTAARIAAPSSIAMPKTSCSLQMLLLRITCITIWTTAQSMDAGAATAGRPSGEPSSRTPAGS